MVAVLSITSGMRMGMFARAVTVTSHCLIELEHLGQSAVQVTLPRIWSPINSAALSCSPGTSDSPGTAATTSPETVLEMLSTLATVHSRVTSIAICSSDLRSVLYHR